MPAASPSLASPVSSTSSASTVRAEGDAASHSSHRASPTQVHDWANMAGSDWRSRSVSAPASRTSSFAQNLDQLVALNQSAHRFPVTLAPVPDSSYSSTSGQDSTSLGGDGAFASSSSHKSSQPVALANDARSTTSRSTPSSPLHSPALRSASPFSRSVPSSSFVRDTSGQRRTLSGDMRNPVAVRARAALFSSGSGFTPAFEQDGPELSGNSQSRIDRNVGSDGRSSSSCFRSGRMRSTSASETIPASDVRSSSSSTSLHSSSGRSRRPRAHSARSSPTLLTHTTLHSDAHGSSEGSLAQTRPQRTNSVPHLARISPIIYSYRYPHEVPPGATFVPTPDELGVSGYFALPPSMTDAVAPTSMSSRDVDELPPPYTPSEANLSSLLATTAPHTLQPPVQRSAQVSRRSSAEDNDDNGGALSFSTNAARSRSLPSTQHIPQPMSGRTTCNAQHPRATHFPPPSVRSDEEVETEADGPVSPSIRSNESVTSPVSRSGLLEGEAMADAEWNYIERLERPSRLRQFVLTYLVHPLRLLATVPGIIGTFWLMRNAVVICWTGGIVWKQPSTAGSQPSALEFFLAAFWSMTTAYHALSFTTLLLRRWLHYYSLFPSLIRLLALQALCWPLVRLTLFILGPRNPLPAWIIISTTTALSDTVARWVVSNITDESDGLSNATLGIGGTTNGDTSNAAQLHAKHRNTMRHSATVSRTGRGARRGGIGMAFWRAIMGAPPRQRSGWLSATMAAAAERGVPRGFATESEAESDGEGLYIGSRQGSLLGLSSSAERYSRTSLALRRRRRGGASQLYSDRLSSPQRGYVSSEVTSAGEGEDGLGELPGSPLMSTLRGSLYNTLKIERVGRIFHWDVAIRRNVLPIGVLAYMTMWILLIEDVRLRWS